MKKATSEMVEALKVEGIRTEEELNEAIRALPQIDLSLMLASAPPAEMPVIRAAG